MKLQRMHPEVTMLDGLRYAGSNLFEGLVLLFTLGRYNTGAVQTSSFKMARRFRERKINKPLNQEI